MDITEIWIDRKDFRKTKIVSGQSASLADGDVLVRIDKFALTSNNVGYALSGDFIGYWGYYPTGEDGWGKLTVWGIAEVVESRSPEIKVGERLYGFFPMASHVVLKAGNISDAGFTDVAAHRKDLPDLYNQYQRTAGGPAYLLALEDERCLLFPLFMTAFVLADYLNDNQYFDAQQILIGSVSSKTGFALAHFLANDTAFKGKVIGLTSSSNAGFVERLGGCDQVVVYGEEEASIANVPSVFVDMSGDGPLKKKLHEFLTDDMQKSVSVGGTHWDAERVTDELPGSQPEFFFTPAHIAKRDADWGAGVLFERANQAGADLGEIVKKDIDVEVIKGAEAAQQIWLDMLDNKVTANRGIMVSI